MEIVYYEKKDVIPLGREENNKYNEQKVFHILKGKFCTDKDDKDYINKKRLKIIAIIQENLEELPIVNVI